MITIGKKKRKEIKFSETEWQRVLMLSAESSKTPEAYIRDRAVNGKVYVADDEPNEKAAEEGSECTGFYEKRSKMWNSMNNIAHTVNANKCVYKNDVDEAEQIIREFEDLARSMPPVKFREYDWIWR